MSLTTVEKHIFPGAPVHLPPAAATDHSPRKTVTPLAYRGVLCVDLLGRTFEFFAALIDQTICQDKILPGDDRLMVVFMEEHISFSIVDPLSVSRIPVGLLIEKITGVDRILDQSPDCLSVPE